MRRTLLGYFGDTSAKHLVVGDMNYLVTGGLRIKGTDRPVTSLGWMT
jgi:hypothetical protein